MAYQFSDIVSQVQSRLNDTTFSTGTIKQFINNVNRRLVNAHRFKDMETSQTLTSSIGSGTLTPALNADYQTPINLKITVPYNYAIDLPYWEYEKFDMAYPQPNLVGNSLPILWTIFANQITVFPNANAAYTFNLRYLQKPTLLVNDTDVPNIPEEFQELLVLGAWAQALENKDYMDESQVIWQQFYALEAQMTARHSRRQLGTPARMRSARGIRVI